VRCPGVAGSTAPSPPQETNVADGFGPQAGSKSLQKGGSRATRLDAPNLLCLPEDDEVALGRLLRAAFESDHEPHVEGGRELA